MISNASNRRGASSSNELCSDSNPEIWSCSLSSVSSERFVAVMRWGVKQSKWFTTVSQRATHRSYTVWTNWRVLSESVTELRGLSDSEWVTDCHSTVSQQSRAEQLQWVMVWFELYIPSNQTVKPCKSYEYLLFRIHFICLEILRLVWWEGKQLSDWNSCLQFFLSHFLRWKWLMIGA